MCIVLWVHIYTRDVDYLYYKYNFKGKAVFLDSLNLKTEDINHVDHASCICWDSMNLHRGFCNDDIRNET